jgi:hypothetical protein
MGFEITIPAFERQKTVHVLDREATVISDRKAIKSLKGKRRAH